MSEVVVITGVGPGLGASLARKFAGEGCSVALLARSADFINSLADELGDNALPVRADVTRSEDVTKAFETIRSELGPVATLINHVGNAVWSDLENLEPEGFEKSWRACAYSGFLCSREAVKDMKGSGGGNILFTGATSAVRGRAGAVGFSSAKFAVRGLADALAREVWPQGIHVAHVIVDGVIDTGDVEDQGPLLKPEEIAESYWMLTRQKPSAWTFELEVRPKDEAFYE